MALDDILQKISDEADKKTAFMKQVADDEIKKIEAESQVRAEKRRSEIKQMAEEKYQSILEKANILAKMEGQSAFLVEKRKMIADVYQALQASLAQLDGVAYAELLVRMLKSAALQLPEGKMTVPCGRKEEMEKAIKKAGVFYAIAHESPDIKDGFILNDHRVEMNMTFIYLIDKIVRPHTELEVAKILFN